METSQTQQVMENNTEISEEIFDTTIENIGKHDGQQVRIRGWLYNLRKSGSLLFLEIRDGSGIIQGVMVKKEIDRPTFNMSKKLNQESSIIVTGNVRADERARGGYELGITSLQMISDAVDYPITPKEHGIEFLMENRHLWLRSKTQHAIMRVRATIIKACRDYFDNRGFVLIDSPILTPAACEGTTTLFETGYFDRKAYLTQSGQLYNEAAAMAFGRVYCFGPTFRAEKSRTRRHLTEFWMIEPEMAYCELEESLEIQEDFIEYLVGQVLKHRLNELEILGRDISTLEKVKKPFPRVHYDDAVRILKDSGRDFNWGDDFGAEDEAALTEVFDRPFFVHHYPHQVKAFYMKKDPQRRELALCADLLAPEGYGEIIGGGQREDDYNTLLESIQGHGLPMEAFKWYLDLRQFGSVPHAGFGLGIERTVAWLCGIHHVREAIPFPRTMNHIYP